jgi:hypothetical protein
MARSLEEITAPEATGPCNCVILNATVALDCRLTIGFEGAPVAPMTTQLVSLVTAPDTARRMRAAAATIARGRQEVTEHNSNGWGRMVNLAVSPLDRACQAAVVLVVPGYRHQDVHCMPAAFDLPETAPVILVTDKPEMFADIPFFQFHGIVKGPSEDLLGTGLTLFRTLLGTMAPETYACTDVEDIVDVFTAGMYAQLAHAVWSPSVGLLLASPHDEQLLRSATAVLFQIELDQVRTLSAAAEIRQAIARKTSVGVPVTLIAPERMFTSVQALGGFTEVSMICACGH